MLKIRCLKMRVKQKYSLRDGSEVADACGKKDL